MQTLLKTWKHAVAFFAAALFLAALHSPVAAQAKTDEAPASKADAPKLLTDAQKAQLGEAQQQFQLARAQFEAAQARLQQAQTVIEGLGLKFALELGLDINKYAPTLQMIDEKAGAIGFLPKTTAPKK